MSSPSDPDELQEVEKEKLDFLSDNFDPMAILYCDKENVKIPTPKAKVYDNIAVWFSNYNQNINESTSTTEPRKISKKKTDENLPQRKWLPHQLPISTKKSKQKNNIFLKMQRVKGPLELLRKFIEEKTRIKIITRNEKGIRGYCIASLLAFDKHFNLLLKDVEEYWTRSIKRKNIKFAVKNCTDSINKINLNSNKIPVYVPEIRKKKISKNIEECRRYVKEMLIRGEQIVLVRTATVIDCKHFIGESVE